MKIQRSQKNMSNQIVNWNYLKIR